MPSYLDLIILFNEYDREQNFSDGASRLYIKLLDVANDISRNRPKGSAWVRDFQRADGYIAAAHGRSKNTMKQHRDELVKRGLVSGDFGQAGRNSSGKYHLWHPSDNVSTSDTISPENESDVDTLPPVNPSTSDTISAETALNVSANVSKVDTLYIEKEEVVVDAASAAAPAPLISEKSETKPKRGAAKTQGATLEEVAALPLPFEGSEFAEMWRTFYTDNSKQVRAGKPISAFVLMLKKLGKFPEPFAVLMIEKAIMGNWQGIENAGTARDFADWQQQQASKPRPAPTTSAAPAAPVLSAEAVARNNDRAAAELAARTAAFQAKQHSAAA